MALSTLNSILLSSFYILLTDCPTPAAQPLISVVLMESAAKAAGEKGEKAKEKSQLYLTKRAS